MKQCDVVIGRCTGLILNAWASSVPVMTNPQSLGQEHQGFDLPPFPSFSLRLPTVQSQTSSSPANRSYLCTVFMQQINTEGK